MILNKIPVAKEWKSKTVNSLGEKVEEEFIEAMSMLLYMERDVMRCNNISDKVLDMTMKELIDLIFASKTLLTKLSEMRFRDISDPEVGIEALARIVYEKNKRRGYYGEA